MLCTWLPEIANPRDGFVNNKQPDTVLLLRGPGHNITSERPDNTKEEDLTPNQFVEDRAAKTAELMGLKFVAAHSNVEGYLINHLHAARQYGAIIFSPGAYYHYMPIVSASFPGLSRVSPDSYALYDTIKVVKTPCIEVHIGNMYAAEDFRKSVLAPVTISIIIGCGPINYEMAILKAKELIEQNKSATP
ncbi:3-dehydroquinate dehydratase [Flagelloscypha sp. PMI_526]|nr:3-dehydroquinate dehydratase [Flagelloscypha sp. PMI_526]